MSVVHIFASAYRDTLNMGLISFTMKPKTFTAIILFISAYSPLFFILGIKDFDFEESLQFANPVAAGILFGLCILSNALIFVFVKQFNKGTLVAKVTGVKSRSQDIVNYTIPYIFCAFDIDFSKMEHIITIALFLLILLILMVKSQTAFLNPMLALYNYQFYDVEYTADGKSDSSIIISNLDLKIGSRYYMKALTRFIYLISKEHPEQNRHAE